MSYDDLVKECKALYVDGITKDKEIERLRNRAEEIDDYDPGILNDYGEGDIDWWMDYIRSEISICNDHWRQALKGEE
ncbi:hypothetical protein LCGC14_2196150 [marine sediment metagenome]|uniref:Uncharacterized protein n=1 Tax=marine sediment metagenome TaxID=412755 RepID=A0A0F9GDX0_9ZZZZ